MKRFLAMLLSLLLALGGVAAAETVGPADVLEQWSAYLNYREALLGAQEWALDYAVAFTEAPTFRGLLLTNAACAAALIAVFQAEPCQQTLSDDAYLSLMEMGMEVGYIRDTVAAAEQERDEATFLMETLKEAAMEDGVWRSGVEHLATWLNLQRRKLGYQKVDLCLTTNYLLLTFPQAEVSSYWDGMDARWPYICQSKVAWETDVNMLTAASLANMDAHDANEGAAAMLGGSQFTLDQWTDALANGDSAVIEEERLTLEDMPATLPLPMWFNSIDTMLQFKRLDPVTGEQVYVQALDTLDEAPVSMIAVCQSVAKSDLNDYIGQLKDLGVTCVNKEGSAADDQKWTTYCFYADSGLSLMWVDGDLAVILTDASAIAFVPRLY